MPGREGEEFVEGLACRLKGAGLAKAFEVAGQLAVPATGEAL